MKLETIEIEKEMTASQLLKEQFGLDSKMYFLSVNGQVAKARSKVKPSDEIKAIPIVKGG